MQSPRLRFQPPSRTARSSAIPARDLIQDCLTELDASDDMRALWHAAQGRATALLGTSGVPSALIAAMLDSARTDRRRHVELFEVLIGQARVDAGKQAGIGLAVAVALAAQDAAGVFGP